MARDQRGVRGRVAIGGQQDGQRTWDLAERVYPEGQPDIPFEEPWLLRRDGQLRALGLALAKGPRAPHQPKGLPLPGLPARIEGSDAAWRIHPDVVAWADEPFEGRTALLSPLDRLVYDRDRALCLFGFDFRLEMFTAKAKRRWGYFALSILHGDRLIGKLDASADRTAATPARERRAQRRPLHARRARRRGCRDRRARALARPVRGEGRILNPAIVR